MKTLFAVLLCAWLVVSPALAQNQTVGLVDAGCGPHQVNFDVKTDSSAHQAAQPDAGKALVYVFEDEKRDNDSLHIGTSTTKVGLDGAWVGANRGKSYLFFPVDPGDHHVCVNWQSSLKHFNRAAAAASLTAEAGKVYYLRARVEEREHRQPAVNIEPVDDAEGKLLIASSALSTSRPKK